MGAFSVHGFFAISGYLITSSQARTRLTTFLIRRFARIFPAYFVSLIIVAFGFSLALTPSKCGWTLSSALAHIYRGIPIFYGYQPTPGTKGNIDCPAGWNGSLWTIKFEIACYLFLALAYLLKRNTLVFSLAALICATVASSLLSTFADSNMTSNLAVQFGSSLSSLASYFFAGSLLWHLTKDRQLSAYIYWLSAGVSVLLLLFLSRDLQAWAAVPFTASIIGVGNLAIGRFKLVRPFRIDPSYGMYLYGFPIQTFMHFSHIGDANVVTFILASLIAAFAFGVASWYIIEKPAIALARRIK